MSAQPGNPQRLSNATVLFPERSSPLPSPVQPYLSQTHLSGLSSEAPSNYPPELWLSPVCHHSLIVIAIVIAGIFRALWSLLLFAFAVEETEVICPGCTGLAAKSGLLTSEVH